VGLGLYACRDLARLRLRRRATNAARWPRDKRCALALTSSILSPGGSWAGASLEPPTPISCSTRGSRRSTRADRFEAAVRFTTAIGACNLESTGRRNGAMAEVSMNRGKRRSDRSGRRPLCSPGRPPVARRDQHASFWVAIALGSSSEEAAMSAGVAQAVGARWFRKAGGMAPAMYSASAKPLSGRYLSFPEREEIAFLRAQGGSIQEIGVVWPVRRRPSRGNYAGMPPPAAEGWTTARPPRRGAQNDPLADRSPRSSS